MSSLDIWSPQIVKQKLEIKKRQRLEVFVDSFNMALANATWRENEKAILHSLVSAIVPFSSPTEEELELVRNWGYYDIKLVEQPCCGSPGACFVVTMINKTKHK